MGRAVVNEFAKMRRLRVVPVVVVMVASVTAMSCVVFTGPGFFESVGDPSARPWGWMLGGFSLAVPVVSPVFLAVLASRQVDIENRGNGWLLSRTSGAPPGHLCRAKFVATGSVVAAATLAQSGLVFGIGRLVGITVAFPAEPWLVYTASVLVVNLVLLALHLLLSALIANQLVGLGIGVLGVFVTVSATGMSGRLAHLLPPWGYYALVTPVDVADSGAAWLDPPHTSVIALGGAGVVVFLFLTRLFDRQEA